MNEDFVTYELAVKLKEKGFNELCYYYYQSGTLDTDNCWNRYNRGTENRQSVPTISQVLKWLREVKGIHITVLPLWEGYYAEVFTKVRWETDDTHQRGLCFNIDKCIYKNETYEAAALAGIEYVLDNLI